MAKLILHLGMHRTGSTAIQASLAANNGNGFLYPQIGDRPFRPHHEDALDQIFARERFEALRSLVFPIPDRLSIREQSRIPMNDRRLAQLTGDGRNCSDPVQAFHRLGRSGASNAVMLVAVRLNLIGP